MKHRRYLFILVFLGITFLASLSVKAYNGKNSVNTNKGTSLPINAGMVYTVVAGVIIGTTLVRRSRSAKASKIF